MFTWPIKNGISYNGNNGFNFEISNQTGEKLGVWWICKMGGPSSNWCYSFFKFKSSHLLRCFRVDFVFHKDRHQPSPSANSIGIWPARYSRVTQRQTLTIYSSVRKRVSLVLRRWTPARTISYRPFGKHLRFAVWCLL